MRRPLSRITRIARSPVLLRLSICPSVRSVQLQTRKQNGVEKPKLVLTLSPANVLFRRSTGKVKVKVTDVKKL